MTTTLAPTYPCGHPRTLANTIGRKNGLRADRWCRRCYNARSLASYHARKAQNRLLGPSETPRALPPDSGPPMAEIGRKAGLACVACGFEVVVRRIDGAERRMCANCGLSWSVR